MTAPAPWIERFSQTRELGRGTMGVVHAADDRVLHREVALKTMPRPHPDDLVALKTEFRARQGVHHPNLVTLYELFADSADCFFTMELVDGPPLGQALAAAVAAADEPRARRLIAQLIHGLAAIHDAGLIHRDIKPSNALVDRDDRVVILDFGLAIATRDAEHGDEVSGTLGYLAPEALWGRTSPASDWFSAGALLYEAVRGYLPWHPERLDQRFVRVDVAAGLPKTAWPWLVQLITDLLSTNAAARPNGDALRLRFPLASSAPAVTTLRPPLVGRTHELAALRDALADTHARQTGIVWLRGASGAGKSRLLAAFLDEAQASGDVVVLRGTCHYTEHLALMALDPLMDELGRLLRSPRLAADAPPPGPAELLFPSLAGLVLRPGRTDLIELEYDASALLRESPVNLPATAMSVRVPAGRPAPKFGKGTNPLAAEALA